jgi:hypothetical protein
MSDIFIVCDDTQSYAPLANLGVGHFNYNNYTQDRNYKNTGPFIGRHLGTYSLRILSKDKIPDDYKEWIANQIITPKPDTTEFREFFKESDCPYGVFAQTFKIDQVVQFAVYEYTKNEPLLVGSISFAGVANWHFPYSYYPLQFNDKKQAEQFSLLLTKLYDWTEELANVK